ncbi:MAG: Protein TolB [Gemmatimonadaceae bacterium]|nr:Protein TolB [Gemmatimonadaceae bacterium]
MAIDSERHPASDARLTLRTLGVARLVTLSDGPEPVELLGTGKPLALIAYLASAPGREASRARLLDLLWADLDPDAARHALRQTLWYIRRRVDGGLLSASPDSIRLAKQLAFDRAALIDAAQEGDHHRVVTLYLGEFFPDFAAPGCAAFEQWADVERRRLVQTFAASADHLARQQLNQGRFREAQALARRLRDTHPDSEASWRLLLESLLASGDQLSARLEANALEDLASREEFELEGSTQALLRTVKAAERAPATATAAPGTERSVPAHLEAALVGRESEFKRILAAWEDARRGSPHRFHVVAKPGLGKSRLLRDVGTRIRAARGRVVTVRAALSLREIPYSRASELAAALAALPGARSISPRSASVLVGLNPTLSSYFSAPAVAVDGDDGFRLRALAVQELLLAVCEEHPLALFVDDLHWCDDPSRSLLSSLASESTSARLLMVVASRPDGRFATSTDQGRTTAIELPPLVESDVLQLVEGLASLPNEEWARAFPRQLSRSTEGSPLLVVETIQHLMDRALLHRADDTWRCHDPAALFDALRLGSPTSQRIRRLSRAQSWLLTLASAVSRGLTLRQFGEAAGRAEGEVREDLLELEQRGFLLRSEDAWLVAHDEIADAALDAAGADGRQAAHGAVGGVLARSWSGDERDARIAATLLSSAGAPDELAVLFRRYASDAFRRGDRRRIVTLARELLGSSAPDRQVRQLVRASPIRWRLGLVSGARTAAVGAILLATMGLGATAAAFRFAAASPGQPDAVLGAAVPTDSGGFTIRSVELRDQDWHDSVPVPIAGTIAPLLAAGLDLNSASGTASPSGHGAIVSLAVDDSGVIDLFQLEPDHAPRRITYARGDDIAPALSPDGREVVFSTARWNELMHYDLALMDLSTGAVRQLTSGDDGDLDSRWAPDGTRIAFGRRGWESRKNALCILSPEAERPICWASDLLRTVAGWLDASHVLIVKDSLGKSRAVSVNVETGEESAYDIPWHVRALSVSPDGRWVYCQCVVERTGEAQSLVFPADRPRRWRTLDKSVGTGVIPIWLGWARVALARAVRIDSGWSHLTVGVAHQMSAQVTDSLGRVLAVAPLMWSVTGSTAAIDSLHGNLLSTAEGLLTVRATSANGVGDSVQLNTGPRRVVEWMLEDWSDTSLSRWYRVGRPLPHVIAMPNGRHVFHNNGEGSFFSAVFSREAVETTTGVALDMTVSVPAALRQWQNMLIDLIGPKDPSRYASAAGHNTLPFREAASVVCSVGFPAERTDGGGQYRVLAYGSDNGLHERQIEESLVSGQWLRLRVQLFPDGRCGVAINGRPLGVASVPGPWFPRAHIMIGGNSYKTLVLVGRVRVRRGVPDDIDWSRLPESRIR